eukprot:1331294-Amorphochlora_amoeboformis.AAC.1
MADLEAESVDMIHQFLKKQGFSASAHALRKDYKRRYDEDLPNGSGTSSFGRHSKRKADFNGSLRRKKYKADNEDDGEYDTKTVNPATGEVICDVDWANKK